MTDLMTLPVGTRLYHGHTESSPPSLGGPYAWFAPDEATAAIYGRVEAYEVVDPVSLWDMGRPEVVAAVDAQFRALVEAGTVPVLGMDTETLARAFAVETDAKGRAHVVRTSDYVDDDVVARAFLHQFDALGDGKGAPRGFGAGVLPTEAVESPHHAERLILRPGAVLKWVESLPPLEEGPRFEARLVDLQERRRQNRNCVLRRERRQQQRRARAAAAHPAEQGPVRKLAF